MFDVYADDVNIFKSINWMANCLNYNLMFLNFLLGAKTIDQI